MANRYNIYVLILRQLFCETLKKPCCFSESYLILGSYTRPRCIHALYRSCILYYILETTVYVGRYMNIIFFSVFFHRATGTDGVAHQVKLEIRVFGKTTNCWSGAENLAADADWSRAAHTRSRIEDISDDDDYDDGDDDRRFFSTYIIYYYYTQTHTHTHTTVYTLHIAGTHTRQLARAGQMVWQ